MCKERHGLMSPLPPFLFHFLRVDKICGPLRVLTWFYESTKLTKPFVDELQKMEKGTLMKIEHKEEEPILLFEEFPSFSEEEEEDKVVPILEEQVLAFEPLEEVLSLKEGKDISLQ